MTHVRQKLAFCFARRFGPPFRHKDFLPLLSEHAGGERNIQGTEEKEAYVHQFNGENTRLMAKCDLVVGYAGV
jgi:hypothetical protein